MIRCSAGMLVLFLLIGCAEQADPQPAAGPAPLADATEMAPGETAEPTEAAPTDANGAEAVKAETAEKETADPDAVKTETIVMKVSGMT